MVAWNDYKAAAEERGSLAFEVFVVVSTPTGQVHLPDVLPDHLAYIGSLEKSGKLMMAGPMSDDTGEEMQGQGMLVLRAASLEEAKALADGDPMHSSGARNYEMKKWMINEGSLSVSVGLSTGGVQLT